MTHPDFTLERRPMAMVRLHCHTERGHDWAAGTLIGPAVRRGLGSLEVPVDSLDYVVQIAEERGFTFTATGLWLATRQQVRAERQKVAARG